MSSDSMPILCQDIFEQIVGFTLSDNDNVSPVVCLLTLAHSGFLYATHKFLFANIQVNTNCTPSWWMEFLLDHSHLYMLVQGITLRGLQSSLLSSVSPLIAVLWSNGARLFSLELVGIDTECLLWVVAPWESFRRVTCMHSMMDHISMDQLA